ncbi:dual specificity protein phosphatase 5, partial [Geospiza fortis]|uniref:protein-tyrosine-phosphatase n=1 Tax=Geospiza fortis TaxID=48883 RepID=A0A6I9HCH3_GEOFO
AVVVLDQDTGHWQKLKKDSTAQIVLNALLSSLPEAGARVCFLKGGYETFNSQYPECCVNGKLISPERTEAERNLASHCEKQSANHKPAYDQGGPVEILPFLYLGSAYHASKCEFLANLHITALLNVSRKSSESFKDQYCYKWIPVEDSHTADISSHFQEAIDFIDQVRRAGGRILVHCEAGISRSPTICMAYLMKTRKLRLDEAFDYIKQRRSLISPNFGFMGQLLQYESEILSSTPSPPVTSCKREAASFFAEELTLGKNFEGSCFAFPTSVLSSVPIHSPSSGELESGSILERKPGPQTEPLFDLPRKRPLRAPRTAPPRGARRRSLRSPQLAFGAQSAPRREKPLLLHPRGDPGAREAK